MTVSHTAETNPMLPASRTPLQRIWREFIRSRLAVSGLVVLGVLAVIAVIGPWFVPQDPYDLMQIDVLDGQLSPGSPSMAGYTYWLGTDDQGRDLVSAIVYGLRVSLLVGIVSTLIAGFVGTSIGIFAAYRGGRIETLIMRIIDLQLSFPTILVALMILAVLGRGVANVILALVIVEWAGYARVARGVAMVERRKEYIEAEECLVIPRWRILFRHLLPNCLPPLVVIATVQTGRAITLEATLSFLGLGVPITQPSLGLLISNGYQYLLSGQYWVSFYPGLMLLIIIVAINLVGDHLRDIINVRRHA